MQKIYLFLIILLSFVSCNSSKQFAKEADSFASGGNFDVAANYYYNALLLDQTNVSAKIGLQKTAQKVLESKFTIFSKLVLDNKIEDALIQYKYNKKYYEKTKEVGVMLEWPEMYNEIFADIKSEYINTAYDNALELMKQNKYDKAETLFENISDLDTTFKNISVLRLNTVLEPMYNQGILQISTDDYKKAYCSFAKVLSYDENYKNCKQLFEEAKRKANVALAILPINTKHYQDLEDEKLYRQISEEIKLSSNPFLKIIDKMDFETQLKSKQIYLSNFISNDSLILVGEKLGINYFLLIDVREVNYIEQALTFDTVIAYESFSDKVIDPATGNNQFVTRFKKTFYLNSNQSRIVNAKIQYSLKSVKLNQVLLRDEASFEKRDDQSFSRFDGNYLNLYPALPAGNFLPTFDIAWRDKFVEFKRDLLPASKLRADCFEEIAKKISEDVNLYIDK